jgi:DNA-binding Xre family transcriptional regulator
VTDLSQLNLFNLNTPIINQDKQEGTPIPTNLLPLLRKRQLTLNQAADQLSVNKGNLFRYADGTLAIPTPVVHHLCDTLACSPNDIYGRHDDPDVMSDPHKVLAVPVTLSKKLYNAVTMGGKISSDKILAISTKLQETYGINSLLTVWLRELSFVVKDIEYWAKPEDPEGPEDGNL